MPGWHLFCLKMGERRRKTRRIHDLSIDHLKKDISQESKLHHESLDYIRKHLDKLWEFTTEDRQRLQDLEIHMNLLTRLFTALCLEVIGLRQKDLKKLIKRAESEAVAESQVMHLEQLFRLPSKEKRSDEGSGK